MRSRREGASSPESICDMGILARRSTDVPSLARQAGTTVMMRADTGAMTDQRGMVSDTLRWSLCSLTPRRSVSELFILRLQISAQSGFRQAHGEVRRPNHACHWVPARQVTQLGPALNYRKQPPKPPSEVTAAARHQQANCGRQCLPSSVE